jgi:hypothetical protein
LTRIDQKIDRYFQAPSKANADSLEYEFKLFGCVLKSTLRNHIQFLRRQIEEHGRQNPQRLETECGGPLQEYLSATRTAVDRFRSFRDRLKSPSLPRDLYSAYVFVDEYVSLLVEGRTHQLLQSLHAVPSSVLEKCVRELKALVVDEVRYRQSMDYPSIVDPGGDNEVFLFRLSVLKKFVSSVLHFRVRTVEEGAGIRHIVLAAGAGIAMLFATAIAFYYQRAYGTLSMSFFIALVISYMFKDRIKAMSQGYLERLLRARLFDQTTNIYDPFNSERIGLCRESVRFVKESDIDPIVMRLRNRDHITEIENDYRSEQVIHYIKEITLYSDHLGKAQSRKTAVTDIVRFSIGNFLARMDEPATDLYMLEDGKSKVTQGSRVYHVNVVIRFVVDKEIRYERIRLVLTRQGIKRIEPVSREVIQSAA